MFVEQGTLNETQLRDVCERNYNNRALVPEHPAILASWPGDARAFREAGDAQMDLPYLGLDQGGSERTKLDMFWPRGAERASCPIAMFIHGGYWQGLDRKAVSHLARGLTGQGVAVAMPSYDLCPDVSLGTIIEQIAAACAWLWRTHKRRFAIAGHSAGGHLAAAMLARDFTGMDASLPADMIPAAMPISGIFDLRDLVYSSINDKVGMSLGEAEAWSPMFAPAPAGKTLHAVVGGAESKAFLWQSQTLAQRWGEPEAFPDGNAPQLKPEPHLQFRLNGMRSGVAASWEAPGGANHFTVVLPLTDPASAMSAKLADMAKMALEHIPLK